MEAARTLRDHYVAEFPDGVFIVAVASLFDSTLVLPAIAFDSGATGAAVGQLAWFVKSGYHV